MKQSLQQKLQLITKRHEEIAELLSLPEVISDQEKFKSLSKEYADSQPVVDCFKDYLNAIDAKNNAEVLLNDSDAEMRDLAKDELEQAKQQIQTAEQQLQILLLPKDPNDSRNIYLEIRAGTGGDEAAIFAGDLYRMYTRYAELKGWSVENMSENQGEHGGYKEVIIKIIGKEVYGQLKFESGAHRVQRVPETETQGRVHTSACTVAVMPEVEEISEIDIDPSDLRVDTFRASGAGGQHVNRTDSAVRITHIPTGVVVECQDDRSQHKNKAKAMALLSSRILANQQEKQHQEQAQQRRNLVGSGDRSERIRTYNFPQGRMTDHRINLTLYKLEYIMQGELDQVVEPLIQEHQADLLAAIND